MGTNDNREVLRQRAGLVDERDRIRRTCACRAAMLFRLTAFATALCFAAAALLKWRPRRPPKAAAANTGGTGSKTIPVLKSLV